MMHASRRPEAVFASRLIFEFEDDDFFDCGTSQNFRGDQGWREIWRDVFESWPGRAGGIHSAGIHCGFSRG
jgi:hypothetical protein